MTKFNKLQKYNAYVPGEKRSKEYERQVKEKTNLKYKHQIADQLFNELPFALKQYEKDHVHYLIDRNRNFKKLHRKASNEAIILAFIFYIKKAEETNIYLNRYSITRKYNLTNNTFQTIICRLLKKQLRETYIIPYEPNETNHNILFKGELK